MDNAGTPPSSPTPAAAPQTPQPKPLVRHIQGWRRLLALPLALLIKAWCRTLRFDIDAETEKAYRRIDTPTAFTLWHNRLFFVAEIARRYRQGKPVHGLVSASRDGAWLETFFEMVGIHSVRGSSSKMGREAASALIDVLRAGKDIGVTPDGPRGPCYDFKAGTLIVAKRGKATILLIGAQPASYWCLKSWDRFIIPKPFTKVKIKAIVIGPEELGPDRDAEAARLSALLRGLNPD